MQEQTARVIDFNPKDGKQPQWKYIHDALKDYEYGTEFSYAELEDICGLSRKRIQALKDKTDRELKKSSQKMLVNVRGYGYRIADPWEQVKEAKGHEKKGGRQVKKAREFLDNVDTSEMTNEEKNRLMELTMHMETKLRIVRKKSLKSLDLTQKAKKNSTKSEKVQSETVAELNNLLEQFNALKSKLNE